MKQHTRLFVPLSLLGLLVLLLLTACGPCLGRNLRGLPKASVPNFKITGVRVAGRNTAYYNGDTIYFKDTDLAPTLLVDFTTRPGYMECVRADAPIVGTPVSLRANGTLVSLREPRFPHESSKIQVPKFENTNISYYNLCVSNFTLEWTIPGNYMPYPGVPLDYELTAGVDEDLPGKNPFPLCYITTDTVKITLALKEKLVLTVDKTVVSRSAFSPKAYSESESASLVWHITYNSGLRRGQLRMNYPGAANESQLDFSDPDLYMEPGEYAVVLLIYDNEAEKNEPVSNTVTVIVPEAPEEKIKTRQVGTTANLKVVAERRGLSGPESNVDVVYIVHYEVAAVNGNIVTILVSSDDAPTDSFPYWVNDEYEFDVLAKRKLNVRYGWEYTLWKELDSTLFYTSSRDWVNDIGARYFCAGKPTRDSLSGILLSDDYECEIYDSDGNFWGKDKFSQTLIDFHEP